MAPCKTLLEGLRTARNKSSFLISCSIVFPIGVKVAAVLRFLNFYPKLYIPSTINIGKKVLTKAI